MIDPKGCSSFCVRYSVVGTLFMLMVAMMLTYQPFYIGGIEDVEKSKRNAYGAMATFIFVFIVSLVYLIMDAIRGAFVGGGRNNGGSGANPNTRRQSGRDYDGILQQNTADLDLPPSVEQAHFT